MRPQDWVLALVAGAPLTSIGGVWLLGVLYSHISEKLTIGRALGALFLLVFNGVLAGSGAVALMRAYTAYHWFHPVGWVVGFSIAWLVLLVIFFITGGERQTTPEVTIS